MSEMRDVVALGTFGRQNVWLMNNIVWINRSLRSEKSPRLRPWAERLDHALGLLDVHCAFFCDREEDWIACLVEVVSCSARSSLATVPMRSGELISDS